MNGDIRPPQRPKTKNPTHSAKRIAKVAMKPPKKVLPEVDLKTIKPVISEDPVIRRSKRVSLARIKKNIRPKHWYNLNKEEQLVLLGGLILIFGAILFTSWFVLKSPTPKSAPVVVKKVAPKPNTVEAPLTGLQIDPALAKRPVTAIMIENSLDARPQSGLQDAGVVFEAIAEGGITRFIALYQDTSPQYIGPVRSLRPYYIDFATPFDAGIAHVGGSPEALDQIRSGGKDLDQFFNSGAYWRQPTRDAPHNVYTSFERLDALNQSKGYTSISVQSWKHKKDKPLAVPSAKSINFDISSDNFNVHYDYDKKSNSYLRSEGGSPHISTTNADDNSGAQLHPKVVIALVMSYNIEADGKHSEYGVDGTGNMYIFQDGGVTQGTWSKAGRSSQFVFRDSTGKDIELNAGQAWISIVSGDNQVSYQP